jgi:predicted HTH domain antitoxin
MSTQLVIQYPENLPDALAATREQFETEARLALAVKLFEMKRISSGIAAGLSGMSRVAFLLSLHRYGTPMIDLDDTDLAADARNA